MPSIYTLHTRSMVQLPSGLSWPAAGATGGRAHTLSPAACAHWRAGSPLGAIFAVGLLGVAFNFEADLQRQRFRETGGAALVWGRKPIAIEAEYHVTDPKSGSSPADASLLNEPLALSPFLLMNRQARPPHELAPRLRLVGRRAARAVPLRAHGRDVAEM